VTAPPREAPAPFFRKAIGLLAVSIALGPGCLFLPPSVRGPILDLVPELITFAAAWLMLRRFRADEPGRLFFLFLALALLIHGALSWSSLLAKTSLPWLQMSPVVKFCTNLAGPLLQGIAVFCWPTSKPGGTLRWRQFLDALLFTVSLFLVFWLLGLGDLIVGAPLSQLGKASKLMVFLDYALLMGLAVYRGLDAPGRFANSLGWLLVAFLVVTAGNLAWISLSLRHLYRPGHPLNAALLVIPTLYLLAALAPNHPGRSNPTRASRWSGLLVPYLPLLVALPLVLNRLPNPTKPQDVVALWLGIGMIGVLLIRQLVALWDSNTFSRDLEAQVQQRTRALEESQTVVLRTQRMNLLATLGAGLAHDLNNLLSVVTVTREIMEEDTRIGQLPAAKDFDAMRRATSQASELVNKLMAFGRRDDPQPRLFDLRVLIQGMGKLLEKLATPSVRLQLELGPVPLLLDMDPIQIEQILVNLVANARDAMPAGGGLLIRTRRCTGPEGEGAELAIVDSGIGIPKENLDHIFDAFFTTKQPGKGTGLGLASVKAILEECGATITVASRTDLGTTFTLLFPLVAVDPQPSEPGPPFLPADEP
jgi:signal transduction histidine kinase